MTAARIALGALLAASACASVAKAQVTPGGMLQGRQARQMQTTATFRLEHDTNIARLSKPVADAQGVSRSDTIFRPSLNSNIVFPLGQQAVFLRGTVGYVFHDKNKELDGSRFDVSGGVANRLGPCGSVVTASYARSRNELEDVTLTANVFNTLEVKRINASVMCARPPGLGVVFGVGQDWGDNSTPETRLSNFETLSANAGFNYSRPALGQLTLAANYARTEYPNRPTLTGETDGYELIGAGITYERKLGARISGTVSGGYTRVEPFGAVPLVPGATNGGVTEFEGFTYSGEVTYRASSRLRASASFDRSISPTLAMAQSYEVQTNYQVQGEYLVGSRFVVSVGAAQSESEAEGVDVPGLALLTESRQRTLQGSLSYRMGRRLSFALRAQYDERTTNNPLLDYNGTLVGLSTDVRF